MLIMAINARLLNKLIEWRGKPVAIRSDNGPEYISGTLKKLGQTAGYSIGLPSAWQSVVECVYRTQQPNGSL